MPQVTTARLTVTHTQIPERGTRVYQKESIAWELELSQSQCRLAHDGGCFLCGPEDCTVFCCALARLESGVYMPVKGLLLHAL